MIDSTDRRAYPMSRQAARCPFDPPAALGELRRKEPISRVQIWDGSEPWLITRYDDIRSVLGHPAISSDIDKPGFPDTSAAIKARRARAKSFFNAEGPEHDEPRAVLSRFFTVKRMQSLGDRVREISSTLIDGMLAGPKPVDLVEALALPVPSRMICELLGVPYSDHRRFEELSKVFVARSSTPDQMTAAAEELITFIAGLVDEKSDEPADDVLSWLAVEQMLAGRMTREQVARIGLLLLTAGHETSANMIALGAAALLNHPDQLELVRRSDDPAMVARAVEELLRYLTVIHTGVRRVATADMEIAGTQIRKGEGVILSIDSGNWDASAFSGRVGLGPDKLDVTRNARHHLAFGFGVHQCLGQQLARIELQVVFDMLLHRIPTLALVDKPGAIEFKQDILIYGLHRFLVTW